MKHTTEKQMNPNEINLRLQTSTANKLTLEDMYDDHMRHFHMVNLSDALQLDLYKNENVRSVGKSLFVHPDYGKGSYWHYIINDQIALLSVDMIYKQDISFSMDTINMFYLGSYSAEITRRHRPDACNRTGTVFGNAWVQQRFHQSLAKNTDLKIMSISFTADAIHEYTKKLGCSLYEMTFAFKMLDGSFDILELYNVLQDFKYSRPHKRYADIFYRNKVEELLLILLDTLETFDKNKVKSEPQYQRIVYEACKYIEAHLDTDLSTKYLSEQLYLSETQLITAFKVVKNMTPQNYIRLVRMDHAQNLLNSNVTYSILQIAQFCGYKNQGAFCDAFKKQFGLTPSSFRKI